MVLFWSFWSFWSLFIFTVFFLIENGNKDIRYITIMTLIVLFLQKKCYIFKNFWRGGGGKEKNNLKKFEKKKEIFSQKKKYRIL